MIERPANDPATVQGTVRRVTVIGAVTAELATALRDRLHCVVTRHSVSAPVGTVGTIDEAVDAVATAVGPEVFVIERPNGFEVIPVHNDRSRPIARHTAAVEATVASTTH